MFFKKYFFNKNIHGILENKKILTWTEVYNDKKEKA